MIRTFKPATNRGRARRIVVAGFAVALLTGTVSVAPAAAAASGSLRPVQAGHVQQAGSFVRSTAGADAAPRAAASPRLRASAAGKLGATGCSEAAGTATCDLYARTASQQILGVATPVWGFSTSSDPSVDATAPGPVLVIHQGLDVTITLHNDLAGQSVSLALPGQDKVLHPGSSGDDRSGVSDGQSRSYTFTASRPGTFLYEAGHTANGARQVAMGLAGALVVLPADATAYGTPGTAYDDDAVLVMTEIDPDLNNDPSGFDMRNFAPKYRMFNGKPFPSSDPISTDQGHTALLRYVNAGSQTHAMSVLGADQVEIAEDGHPMQYPSTVSTESIEPGQTLDTLVKIAPGPEAKLAVFEAALHLDNNGQTTDDPNQLAFGGMLTFLDTNAPPPSTDDVGPVTAHILASPNPSNGLGDVTVTADLSDATTGGNVVDQAEFVVDDAVTTGVGFGEPMTTGTFGAITVGPVSGTIPAVPKDGASCTPAAGPAPVALSCLDAGKHVIYVRAHDAAGKDPAIAGPYGNWGVIGSVVFNLPKKGPQTTNGSVDPSPTNGSVDVALSTTGDDSATGGTITAAEYFMDAVASNGVGDALTLNRQATVVSEDVAIPAATVKALVEGTHHILVRSKNSLGLWGPTLDVPLIVDKTGPGVTAAAVGPNPTNGQIGDASNPDSLVVSAEVTDPDTDPTAVPGATPTRAVVAAEAFLDPASQDVPVGTGLQLIAVDGAMDSPTEAAYALIPLSEINGLTDGPHEIWVRGKDAAGNWGPLKLAPLSVDKTAPTLGGLTVTPNPTNGAVRVSVTATYVEDGGVLTGAEYWIGTNDPGAGNATQTTITTTAVNGVKTVSASGLSLRRLTGGKYQVNFRVIDNAGNWSAPAVQILTVTPYLANFRGSQSPTTGSIGLSADVQVDSPPGLTAVEYWVGNRDPGVGRATRVNVANWTVTNGVLTVTGIPFSGLAARPTFNVRALDSHNRWSNIATGTVTVRQNLVFASIFQNASLGDWPVRTGQVSSSTAANLRRTPAIEVPLSTRGLLVAVPATTGNRTSYVTDTTPAGETQYFARFLFNQNTLNSGSATNILTIFEGRTANGQAFALQYRGTGTSSQFRLAIGRNGTTLPVTGTWVAAGAGTKLIELSWAAAVTATANGSVTLKVGGVAVSTASTTNSQYRIENAYLGASAGVVYTGTGRTSGTAYFDSFTSTRFTNP